jgi:hypothetical protein
LDGLNWLTSEEKAQVKRVFDSANLTDVIDQEITEQAANSLNITVEETDDSNEESTTLKFQSLKFGEKTRVDLIKDDGFLIKFYHLYEEEEVNKLLFISSEDGKVSTEKIKNTSEKTLPLIDLREAFAPQNDQGISTQAWYDDAPCVADGCCVLNEPAPPLGSVPIAYNYCGANCGSGDPVNGTDRCCRTHDNCYGSFSTYPTRCDCDQNLIDCLSPETGQGPAAIQTVFRAKMTVRGC